jgi:hypothetical protein
MGVITGDHPQQRRESPRNKAEEEEENVELKNDYL